jgi:hypothetical protein
MALKSAFAGSGALALLALLGVLQAQTASAAEIPGAIRGEFSVSATGAASYRVPLQLPPGVAGLQPNLALRYNSQSGMGVAGAGWSLDGVQSITRCPQTTKQDGARTGVALTYADRFCLNGQRLVLAPNQAADKYGKASSTYRLEIDDFSRVTAQGVAGDGPESFKVELKNGQVLTFGKARNANLLPALLDGTTAVKAETVLAWYLSSIQDPSGNTIEYGYKSLKDTSGGEVVLDTVSYAGGLHQVQFEYVAGSQPSYRYLAGVSQKATQLLSGISVKTSSKVVRQYTPKYEFKDAKGEGSASGAAARMVELEECFGDKKATPSTNCLPVTKFGWEHWKPTDRQVGLHQRIGGQGTGPQSGVLSKGFYNEGGAFSRQVLDIDADGFPDVVVFTPTGLWAYFGRGLGVFDEAPVQISDTFKAPDHEAVWYSPLARASMPFYFHDLDGDGVTELVLFQNSAMSGFGGTRPVGTYVARWDRVSRKFAPLLKVAESGDLAGTLDQCDVAVPKSPGDYAQQRFLVSLGSDGRADVLRHMVDGIKAAQWGTSSFGTSALVGSVWAKNCRREGQDKWGVIRFNPFYISDMSGDGLPDLLYLGLDGVKLSTWNEVARVFSAQADVSGDMKGGDAFDGRVTVLPTYLVDVNGDGFPDIVQFRLDGIYVAIWNGIKFMPATKWTSELTEGAWIKTNESQKNPRFLADMDGDGLIDLVGIDATGIYVALGNGKDRFGKAEAWSTAGTNPVPVFVSRNKCGQGDVPDASGNCFTDADKTPRLLSDINGDGVPDIVGFGDQTMVWAPVGTRAGQRINAITDGLEAKTVIGYGLAQAGDAAYSKPSAVKGFPLKDTHGPLYIVRQVDEPTGLSGGSATRRWTYRYGERRADYFRGDLGFAWMERTDQSTEILERSEFWQEFPYIGLLNSQKRSRQGLVLADLTQKWSKQDLGAFGENAAAQRQFVYVEQSLQKQYDLKGNLLRDVTTDFKYAEPTQYGNLTSEKKTFGDGHVQETGNTYFAVSETDLTAWRIGRLDTSTVNKTRPAVTLGYGSDTSAAPKAPPAAVTLQPLNFGDQVVNQAVSLTAKLRNGTNVSVALNAIGASSVTGAGFTFKSTTCGTSLQAAASCDITVDFKPTVQGQQSGQLSVGYGAGQTLRAQLLGNGVLAGLPIAFSQLDFGAVATNVSKSLPLELKNTGASPLVLTIPTDAQRTGSAAFSITGHNCPASLGPAGTCQLTFQLKPLEQGPLQATYPISASGFPSANLALLGSGAQPGGGILGLVTTGNPVSLGVNLTPSAASGRSLTFRNTGTGQLTFGSVSSSGETAHWNGSPGNCGYGGTKLAAGDTCTVYVYSSAPEGTRSGTLTINSDGGNASVPVSGSFKGKLSGGGVTFSNVAVGGSASQSYTVSNSANYPIRGLVLSATAPYSIESSGTCASGTIAAGGSCSFTLKYSPTGAGAHNGSGYVRASGRYNQVWFSADGSSTVEGSQAGDMVDYAMGVTGNAVTPSPLLTQVTTGNPVSLGVNLTPSAASGRSLTFRNTGTGQLTFGSVSSSGETAHWNGSPGNCGYGGTKLAAGDTCTVYVYSSAPEGTRSGTLTINSDGGNASVPVSGSFKGKLSGGGVTFSNVAVGGSASQSYTVSNSANYPIRGLVLSATAPYSIESSGTCASGTIAAGGSCSFTLKYSPTGAGAHNGSGYVRASGRYNQVWFSADGSSTVEGSQAGDMVDYAMGVTGNAL